MTGHWTEYDTAAERVAWRRHGRLRVRLLTTSRSSSPSGGGAAGRQDES